MYIYSLRLDLDCVQDLARHGSQLKRPTGHFHWRMVYCIFLELKMKSLISALVLIALLALPAISEEAGKRYDVKTGIIEYKISGVQSGTETLYFDDWGRTESKVTKINTNFPNTPKTSEYSMSLIKDGKSYAIDMLTNKGTESNNLEVFALSGDSAPRAQMSTATTTKINVAGKECQIWKSLRLDVETCLWSNVPLQTTSGRGKTAVSKTATSIKLVDSLPEDTFKLPENVQLTQIKLDDLFNIPTG